MERLSRRVAGVAESVTLSLDAKGKALKAAGEPVISFGAGEPDFATPDHIVEAAVAACRDPKNHKYTPTSGLPELRAKIAEKTANDSGFSIDASQVLVTNGGKQAVEHACMSIIDDGDEVLLPAPYWTTYPELVRIAGGKPVEVYTDEATGFKVTVEQLENAKTDRTKAMIFVSPSNPTGAVYTREEMRAVGQWCVQNDVWVIADEIYEKLIFGDAEFNSMPVVVPELADTCLIINGVAKTFAMTGWRVGWLIGPQDVIKAAGNRHSHAASNVNNVAQRATLSALSGDMSSVEEMRAAFDRRRQMAIPLINEISGFSCIEPKGAFYAFANVTGTFGYHVGSTEIVSSMDLASALIEHAKVVSVPGEAFGAPGYLRFSYAMADDDIREGLERIAKTLAG